MSSQSPLIPHAAARVVLWLVVAVCLAFVLCDSPVSACPPWYEPENSIEFRASTFTVSAQHEAAMDIDRDGNVIVVWASRRQNQGRSGIFAQRFAPNGVAIGQETRISLWDQSHQTSPAIACSPRGETWIVWQSHRQDGDGAAIIARRFDSDFNGSSEILINQTTRGDQFNPAVCVHSSGAALFTWTTTVAGAPDASLAAGTQQRIAARLFGAGDSGKLGDFDGEPRCDEFFLTSLDIADTQRSQSLASAAFQRDGSFAVICAMADADGTPAGLRLQRFTAQGEPAGELNAIASREHPHAIEPVIVPLRFGGYLIAWCSALEDRGAADYDIYAQRFSPEAEPIGAPFRVNSVTEGVQNAPAIAADELGHFAVAFNSGDGDETGVFAQMFNGDGTPYREQFRVTRHVPGKQLMREATGTRRMAFNRRQELICAWQGNADQGDDSAINITLLSNAPLRTGEGEARGVTAQMQPAQPATGALAQAAGGDASHVPQPHEPPVFDPRSVDTSAAREVTRSLDDIGFTGILTTGWAPPDPHMSVGPDHIVLMTNGAIAFFSKAGALLFQDEIEGPNGFWGALTSTNLIFDPETLYDPMSQRFFAMATESIPPNSFILIAVSDDSDPTGTWHKYRISTTSVGGGNFDSPNMGVDDEVLYITGDRSSGTNQYGVLTFDKASLLVGAPPAIQQVTSMPTSVESAGIPPISAGDPPAYYLIESQEAASNTIVRLVALSDPLGTPTFQSFNLTVPAYTNPPEDPPQAGTTVRPEAFEARFWSCAYRNGYLWATHHQGTSRCLVRWYQIAMNGWPSSGADPTLVQSGTIDPGPTVRTSFSAITADDSGNAMLVFARSAPTEPFQMCTAYRHFSDPPGTFQPPIVRKASVGPYFTNRWGDYGAIAVDPVDGTTVWAHHEHSESNSWRTWVQGFAAPAPVNDNCTHPMMALVGVDTPFTNVGATTDGPTDCPTFTEFQIGSDVWFRFVSPCNGPIEVGVCEANYDTKIGVYPGTCPTGDMEIIMCNEDGCGPTGLQSVLTFQAESGEEYLVRIGGFKGAQGAGTLTLSCVPASPCPADFDDSDEVDIDDLFALLGGWGSSEPLYDISPPGSPNGVVDIDDLFALIEGWGPCP